MGDTGPIDCASRARLPTVLQTKRLRGSTFIWCRDLPEISDLFRIKSQERDPSAVKRGFEIASADASLSKYTVYSASILSLSRLLSIAKQLITVKDLTLALF